MRRTFIIASTGDRFEGLMDLLVSLTPFFRGGWHAVVVGQGYSQDDARSIMTFLGENGDCVFCKDLIGAHSAKMIALNKFESDVWCSLDDDMVAIEITNYDKMAEILWNNRNIGLISGNWGRTPVLARKRNPEDVLVKQKLVYTGGGLMFRDDVADIVRNIKDQKYLFDDCLWALYAYINGYDNYRYMGSVAVHRICTKGGRRTWLKKTRDRILPPSEYLRCRKSSDLDGYYMCLDKDITALAHQKHKENKKER